MLQHLVKDVKEAKGFKGLFSVFNKNQMIMEKTDSFSAIEALIVLQ